MYICTSLFMLVPVCVMHKCPCLCGYKRVSCLVVLRATVLSLVLPLSSLRMPWSAKHFSLLPFLGIDTWVL